MKKISYCILIISFLGMFVMVSCGGGDYTPKPQAYLRIDMPDHDYALCDTMGLPFTFEKSTLAGITLKKRTSGETWVDLNYPQWQGVVFLTYRRLRGAADLRGQTDTSMRLMESHHQLATGVDEHLYVSDDGAVHAVTWHIKGRQVASTYQFYATDSLHHFLRGALYLDRSPNNDSLSPVLNYLQADLDHLVETLRWR